MAKTYDVIVVGAGMVGALEASLLAQKNLRVALIDQSSGKVTLSSPPRYDTRVSALSSASQALLERVGVWQTIAPNRLAHYQAMKVWDGLGSGAIEFTAMDNQLTALGCLVENAVLTQALLTAIAAAPQIETFFAEKVLACKVLPDKVSIELASGLQLEAALLVAADGANSFIRQQAGFATVEWDYGHHAIVATIEVDKPHQATAWQAFGEEGILALLPLPSVAGRHIMSIVWSVSPADAAALCQLDEAAFCRRLGYAIGRQFEVLALHSERTAIPLRQRHAQHYVQARIALVGDAAHTIHPLAGQGANIGFADAGALADIIAKAHARADDIGRERVLRRYQRARMLQNLQMSASMEGFKRLYASQSPLLVLARNKGLNWLSRCGPFKKAVIAQALGDVVAKE